MISSAKRFTREFPEVLEALEEFATAEGINLSDYEFYRAMIVNLIDIEWASWYPVGFDHSFALGSKTPSYSWINYEIEEGFTLVEE